MLVPVTLQFSVELLRRICSRKIQTIDDIKFLEYVFFKTFVIHYRKCTVIMRKTKMPDARQKPERTHMYAQNLFFNLI